MSRNRIPINLKDVPLPRSYLETGIKSSIGITTTATGLFLFYKAISQLTQAPGGSGSLGDPLVGLITCGIVGSLLTSGSLMTYSGAHVTRAAIQNRPARPLETFLCGVCCSIHGLFVVKKGLDQLNKSAALSIEKRNKK